MAPVDFKRPQPENPTSDSSTPPSGNFLGADSDIAILYVFMIPTCILLYIAFCITLVLYMFRRHHPTLHQNALDENSNNVNDEDEDGIGFELMPARPIDIGHIEQWMMFGRRYRDDNHGIGTESVGFLPRYEDQGCMPEECDMAPYINERGRLVVPRQGELVKALEEANGMPPGYEKPPRYEEGIAGGTGRVGLWGHGVACMRAPARARWCR